MEANTGERRGDVDGAGSDGGMDVFGYPPDAWELGLLVIALGLISWLRYSTKIQTKAQRDQKESP